MGLSAVDLLFESTPFNIAFINLVNIKCFELENNKMVRIFLTQFKFY